MPDASVSVQRRIEAPRYPLEIVAWRDGDRVRISLRVDRAVLERCVGKAVSRTAGRRTMSRAEPTRRYPLTSMQKGILFHALLNPGAGLYVQQVVVTFAGQPNLSALRQAWDDVLAHHSILRTTFRWKGLDAPHLLKK